MFSVRLLSWSIISALAGFLFGFDTVVISGAGQSIQELWQLTPLQHGLATSSALWGTVLGSLIGTWPTNRWGRVRTLFWVGVLYFLSAVWSGFALGPWDFAFARFIGGLGVGVSTIVSPIYITEIAPPQYRGRLTGLFQFNIVFGILIAFASNYFIGKSITDHAWRWMMGAEAIPALFYTLMCLTLPESPRWLLAYRHDAEAALAVMHRLDPRAPLSLLQTALAEQRQAAESAPRQSGGGLWRANLRRPVLLAILVAFFNQLSGINAILYFAPRIFEMTGLGAQSALLQSIGIGVTNLIFTFVGLGLIDLVGRRTLLYWGSAGYIVSLGLCSWAFFNEQYSLVPACIFGFIAAHALGQGTVIWVLISEVFPSDARAAGQSLGSFTHWFFCALLTMLFPKMVASFPPGGVFLFFCLMMVAHLLWVMWMVPETKGRPLEAIERELGVTA
jgi:MFS transporter, SP family, arabinose:H+ symporter